MTTPLTLAFYPPHLRTPAVVIGSARKETGASGDPVSSDGKTRSKFLVILENIDNLSAGEFEVTFVLLVLSNAPVLSLDLHAAPRLASKVHFRRPDLNPVPYHRLLHREGHRYNFSHRQYTTGRFDRRRSLCRAHGSHVCGHAGVRNGGEPATRPTRRPLFDVRLP